MEMLSIIIISSIYYKYNYRSDNNNDCYKKYKSDMIVIMPYTIIVLFIML